MLVLPVSSTYAAALDQQTTLGLDAGFIEVSRTAVRDKDFGAIAGVFRDALPHARAIDLIPPAVCGISGVELHDLYADDAGHQPNSLSEPIHCNSPIDFVDSLARKNALALLTHHSHSFTRGEFCRARLRFLNRKLIPIVRSALRAGTSASDDFLPTQSFSLPPDLVFSEKREHCSSSCRGIKESRLYIKNPT